jgi:hypothetical protein
MGMTDCLFGFIHVLLFRALQGCGDWRCDETKGLLVGSPLLTMPEARSAGKVLAMLSIADRVQVKQRLHESVDSLTANSALSRTMQRSHLTYMS